MAKPIPSSAMRLAAGTRTSSNCSSQWPSRSVYPNTGRLRTMVRPGVPRGTRIIDCCWWRAASGSVLPMTMKMAHRSDAAPEIHHLRPFSTYSSPSRRIDSWMLVASDEATSGSVMAKADRMRPSSSGTSHSSFCWSVPNRASTSMFPVSGAEQFMASEARWLRPASSAR